MVQRFSISCLGVLLLVACGGGSASDPPAPVNQDSTASSTRPTVGSQDPTGNSQDPTTPSQRPTPPAQGVVVSVGPIDTSAGGSSGGSGNTGRGGSGNDSGGGGKLGGGKCTADDFCASCDTSDCPTYCACLNDAANGALDCTSFCQQ